MPLDSYASLQASVLGWLARPGDPLVAPAVPDMVRLFEAEANRRLRVDGAQTGVFLTATPGSPVLTMPADFQALHDAYVSLNGDLSKLDYLPTTDPLWASLLTTSGRPKYHNPHSGALQLGPVPDNPYLISVNYTRGVPPLGVAGRTTNWLLTRDPDAYLFGALAEAEAYIGHDERIALWLQRRDAAFASIEMADRKLRWSGGPLQIRVDGITGTGGAGGSGSTSGGGVASASPSPVRTLTPASGSLVTMLPGEHAVYVAGAAALLTVRLPPLPIDGLITISFEHPVVSLAIQDSGGAAVPGAPTSVYGPGASVQFQHVDTGWVYW